MKNRENCRNVLASMVVMALLLLVCGLGQAQDAIEVDIQADGITATQLAIPYYWYMKLRIAGPDGRLVCSLASEDDSLFWEPDAAAPDGRYRYEVVVLTYDPDLGSGKKEDGPSGEGLIRTHGGFRLEGGMIIVPEPPAGEDLQQGWWRGMKKTFLMALARIGDFLVPSAEAADLTAESAQPSLLFDDTDDESPTTIWDWKISTEGGSSDTDHNNTFKILGWTEEGVSAPITIIELRNDGTKGASSSENSMVVDYNGDIDLADGALFINKNSFFGPCLAIGSTGSTSLYNIDIHSIWPEIRWYDETDSSSFFINLNDHWASFKGDSGTIFKINIDAPEDTMIIGSNGYTTFYRSWNHASGDGLTSLVALKANNTASAASYCSDVGFALINERENFIWNFRTAEDYNTGFMITKAGSGGPEMLLKNSTTDHTNVVLELGNGAWCDGTWHSGCSRTLKKNIKPLGSAEALQAFKQLEPVTYVYKAQPEDPKVGFIAEDMPDLVADPGKKSVSSTDIVALLTKVVQEQQKEIAALKADNQALKADLYQKIALLERQLKAFTSLASAK